MNLFYTQTSIVRCQFKHKVNPKFSLSKAGFYEN